MAKAGSKVPLGRFRNALLTKGSLKQWAGALVHEKGLQDRNLPAFFPCVLYECTPSFEITFVSSNAKELINSSSARLIGTRAFWHERVLPEDFDLLAEASNELKQSGAMYRLHRIVDDCGLPVWIAHSLGKVGEDPNTMLRGCIVPIRSVGRDQELNHRAISRFIHKLGNHFQLMTLLLNPLRKMVPDCREAEVLEQTIEKSIDLTKAFSDYGQHPAEMSEIGVCSLLESAIGLRESSFSDADVALRVSIEDALDGASLWGDAGLLESAIGHVLQNALEATPPRGQVSVEAKLEECAGNGAAIMVLCVTDTGPGIPLQDLSKVNMVFYTTKKNHEGLGLSMVNRFIGLHGGSCRIDSRVGEGTKVALTLPVTFPSR